jgi:hypothetical protein
LDDKSADGDNTKPKLTVPELKAKLSALNIDFKGNASGVSLQELLDKHEAEAALVAGLKAKLTEKGVSFEDDATAEQLQELLDKAV